jgi:hypothetical protein
MLTLVLTILGGGISIVRWLAEVVIDLFSNKTLRPFLLAAVAAILTFAAGWMGGHRTSDATRWRDYAVALESAQREQQAATDADGDQRVRDVADRISFEKRIATYARQIHTCKLSAAELDGLRKLAADPAGQ